MNTEYFHQLQSQQHPLKGVAGIYPPSETVPGMDMKPAEIIERCVRHLPIPISYRETFVLPNNLSDDEMLDYTPAVDEFEVMDRQKELLEQISEQRKKAKNSPLAAPSVAPPNETPPETPKPQ